MHPAYKRVTDEVFDNLQDCMYLHDLGDGAASFTKEEMQDG